MVCPHITRNHCPHSNIRLGLVNVNGNSVSPLPDYSNLQSQLAKVSPTGVQMASYSPSNTPAACPTVQTNWSAVATPLPYTPNKELCACMYSSLGCTVTDNTDADSYGKLFGTVCGLDEKACDGIANNGTTGTYGAYGMCDSSEQLSAHALDCAAAHHGEAGESERLCDSATHG